MDEPDRGSLPCLAHNRPQPSNFTLQDLCQAALQASPCPLSSSADCPTLSTLEGAAAALWLLTAACVPLRCRWILDSLLNLRRRLQHQLDTQGAVNVMSSHSVVNSSWNQSDTQGAVNVLVTLLSSAHGDAKCQLCAMHDLFADCLQLCLPAAAHASLFFSQ